jgi:hypothetical protein
MGSLLVKSIASALLVLWPCVALAADPIPPKAAEPPVPARPAAKPDAAPPTTPAGTGQADAATEEARKHFRTGVKLYNDGNYDGARAEFEAAYALKPGPSSLQNIALCQKAQFHYVEAVDTLDRLLAAHGTSLSDAEKQAVQTAIAELNGVIGTIVVDVSPADASITLDGTPVAPAQRDRGIRVSVGEHTLEAKASGYAPGRGVVRVVGGQKAKWSLALRATAGFVDVVADDPEAAIAIDDTGLAYGRWSGPLSPGRHYVQVYKAGYETFEKSFWLEPGQKLPIAARLGPKDDSADESDAPSQPGTVPRPPQRPQRGFYALGALSLVGLDEAPQDLNIDKAKSTAGGSLGVRAGYRLWTPVGAEFVLEGGQHKIPDACQKDALGNCVDRSYTLSSLRVGGAVRLMSSGSRLRFTATLGVGAVRHKLHLARLDESKPGGDAEGFDPFFMAELGAQYNAGHVLLELCLVAFLDGASNLNGRLDGGEDTPVFGDHAGALPMLGAGLRVGWGEWRP